MTTIPPQQQRENPEPDESLNPIPWFVILLTGLLLAFGVIYIARSAITNAPALGDDRVVAELQVAAQRVATGAAVDGAALFASHCAACHQATGLGLPGVFPPLARSEWVLGADTVLAAIVLHGLSGSLTVEGKTYAGAMPAFAAQLQDAEIAAVLSHERSSWGNQAPAVSETTVAAVRKSGAARTTPIAGEKELLQLKQAALAGTSAAAPASASPTPAAASAGRR
ncbi:MAG: c-type cytochrome [Burkholderiales bacterium]|nr:c-type cytochrome [Burkholderiales bacterium]